MAKWFRVSHLLQILALTLVMGIGIYAAAWQFNDGKINQRAMGTIFLGMAFPNLFIAGVLRLFRAQVGKIFAGVAVLCGLIGIVLLIV